MIVNSYWSCRRKAPPWIYLSFTHSVNHSFLTTIHKFSTYPSYAWVFCRLLKKSKGNPYQIFYYFSQLFGTNAPIKKIIKKFNLPPSHSTLKYWFENRPWVRGLRNILPQILLKLTFTDLFARWIESRERDLNTRLHSASPVSGILNGQKLDMFT